MTVDVRLVCVDRPLQSCAAVQPMRHLIGRAEEARRRVAVDTSSIAYMLVGAPPTSTRCRSSLWWRFW